MEKDKTYYEQLFARYLDDECTPEELEEVLDYIGKDEANRLVLEQMQAAHSQSFSREVSSEESEWSERVRLELLKRTNAGIVVPFYKRKLPGVAAAVMLLLVSTTAYYYFNYKNKPVAPPVTSENKNETITPGGNKATLTLADGAVIDLSETENGNLAFQGNAKVIKLEDQLNYTTANTKNNSITYNTVTTPRGGQYVVVLSDGSKVWLNAASSLKFPTTFKGTDRQVELTGEGYFEIAKSILPGGKKQPFYVNVHSATGNGGTIEVLGTHFNIMAYDEEAEINTTLLEGSVKVNMPDKTVFLTPGQQAHVTKSDKKTEVLTGVDIESVIAWKNGEFRFDNMDVKAIMRQIGRWYDVNIVYEAGLPETGLSGKIERKKNIEQLLEILETTHKVQFNIKGKNIIVSPYKES
ncbi:MAG: FecR family protein [Sphingobacteriales bacterium]|nr:FecR family protein [Sphingobacteriales bacterium]OJY85746.1 MAG: hypothetical protein BGP14_17550 [Sphingobacteriales bacterium 44-15]